MLVCTNPRSMNCWHDTRHHKGFSDDLQHLRSEILHTALFLSPKQKHIQARKEWTEWGENWWILKVYPGLHLLGCARFFILIWNRIFPFTFQRQGQYIGKLQMLLGLIAAKQGRAGGCLCSLSSPPESWAAGDYLGKSLSSRAGPKVSAWALRLMLLCL